LTSLPILSINLKNLNCSNNLLTTLPEIPENLLYLNCVNNNITLLPTLPETLIIFYCNDDLLFLYDGDWIDINIKTINKNIKIINNFRQLYYSLKFKSKFRKILWEIIREPKIKNYYSPTNLIKFLNENQHEDLDKW
jgi:hypothetical protein